MTRRKWVPPDVPFTRATSAVSKNGLYASIRRGDTRVILPGVFLSAAAWPQQPMAQHLVRALARQMRWPNLVSSHETAALASGMPLIDTEQAAASQPRYTRAPESGARSTTTPPVTVRRLPPEALTELPDGPARGLRLTTPARTALDLAMERDLPEALMLTDHVARISLQAFAGRQSLEPAYGDAEAQYPQLSLAAQQAAMRQLRAAAVCKGHWSSRVRRILELTNPLRESPAESASFGHFVEGGLPVPEVQAPFSVDGRLLRSDFYWREFGLVGECDGSVKYDGSCGPSEFTLVRQNDREQAFVSFSSMRMVERRTQARI